MSERKAIMDTIYLVCMTARYYSTSDKCMVTYEKLHYTSTSKKNAATTYKRRLAHKNIWYTLELWRVDNPTTTPVAYLLKSSPQI